MGAVEQRKSAFEQSEDVRYPLISTKFINKNDDLFYAAGHGFD